jgi:hypothetical protein
MATAVFRVEETPKGRFIAEAAIDDFSPRFSIHCPMVGPSGPRDYLLRNGRKTRKHEVGATEIMYVVLAPSLSGDGSEYVDAATFDLETAKDFRSFRTAWALHALTSALVFGTAPLRVRIRAWIKWFFHEYLGRVRKKRIVAFPFRKIVEIDPLVFPNGEKISRTGYLTCEWPERYRVAGPKKTKAKKGGNKDA